MPLSAYKTLKTYGLDFGEHTNQIFSLKVVQETGAGHVHKMGARTPMSQSVKREVFNAAEVGETKRSRIHRAVVKGLTTQKFKGL